MPGEPKSKSRHRSGIRNGRIYTYADGKTAAAQETVGWLYRSAVGPGAEPEDGGFGIEMEFYVKKRQRRDVDNFVKLVLDGLTGKAWVDDHQVTEIHARVLHGADTPRSEIHVYPTDDLPGKPSVECQFCGNTIQLAAESEVATRKYCNRECQSNATRRKREKTCPQCTSTFYPRDTKATYCSTNCKTAAGQILENCDHCGSTVAVGKAKRTKRFEQRTFCNADCYAAFYSTRTPSQSRGVCEDCGGATSKKIYKRCRSCFLLSRGNG